jgi:alpha-amylase
MKFTNGGYYFGKEGLKATVTATAIRNITAQTDGETKVFTLDGRLIRTAKNSEEALSGLPKGIYIINNKKFVIK